MTSFLHQSKALILIIKDYQAQLLLWQKKTLTHLADYADFQEGAQNFDQALDKFDDFPVVLVGDFIEESFRNETVVHVSANDRKALLERKLSYSFRNTKYRIARITGREAVGRRDDTVMLSALTKPELVNPWVEAILRKNMQIQSVTSVAYLEETFLKLKGAANAEHLMLISVEDDAHLRQTYLKQGRVMFSRLTNLSSAAVSAIGENIHQESLQIRQYLERIKLISYESVLQVRVYADLGKNDIAQKLHSTQLNPFECFDTKEEILHYNVNFESAKPGPLALFLSHILTKNRVENTYADFNIRRYFHLNVISQYLVISGCVLIVAAMAIKTPALSDTINRRNLEQLFLTQAAPFRAEYDQLRARFPETPIESKEMALVVETAEVIKKQSYSPTQALSFISQALLKAPNLQITQIDWSLIEKPKPADEGFYSYNPPSNVSPENQYIKAVLENRSMLRIAIAGMVYSPNSYRDAQDQVLAFVDALGQVPNSMVVPLKMPTDVRSDIQVQTTVGDSELRAPFLLQLTLDMAQ